MDGIMEKKNLQLLCRKAAEAQNGGSIEIWGDGNKQGRFCG